MSNQVRFRAAHPFQGDERASQLSFGAGSIISVDFARAGTGGWVWGTLFGSSRSGWVPQSYLVLHHNPPAAAPAPATRAPQPPAAATRAPPQQQRAATRASPQQTAPPQQQQPAARRAPPPQQPADPARNAYMYDEPSTTVPAYQQSYDSNEEINDGFSGPIMGGSASDATAFRASAPPVMQTSSSKDDDAPNNPFAKGLSNFGSKARDAGRNSVSAVSSGAKKAGQFAKHTAAETQHRFQDMRAQQQAANQNSNATSYASKPGQQQPEQQTTQQQQRTRSEQVQINAMNGAARGAVVGGAWGLACNGVRGVKGGATRGGIVGGAHGAVRGWKPFG